MNVLIVHADPEPESFNAVLTLHPEAPDCRHRAGSLVLDLILGLNSIPPRKR